MLVYGPLLNDREAYFTGIYQHNKIRSTYVTYFYERKKKATKVCWI
jgi:hypothetical protein